MRSSSAARAALVGMVAVVVPTGHARAEDLPPSPLVDAGSAVTAPAADLGDAALPGGLRVGYAETLPAKELTVGFDGGFGYRSGLLGANHKMKRGLADLAFGYAATPWLSLGIAFDGRYDTHKGGGQLTDNGWVGEPRLLVRAARAAGAIGYGGQLTLSAPGANAPSLVPSAITVEARGLLSGRAGALRWAVAAGYRLDNSAESIDNPGALTLADQASLGVSAWSAVVAGGRVAYRAGKLTLGLESDARIFVGSDAPGPAILAAATLDAALTPRWALTAFVGTNIVDKPSLADPDMAIPLQPYDPAIVAGLGLTGRFGGVTPASATTDPETDGGPVEPPPVVRATLAGVVTDDAGAPMPGATVAVQAGDVSREVTTGADGRFVVDDLPLGSAEVTVTSEGRKPRTFTVELSGATVEAPATALDAEALPSQIRGFAKDLRTSKPVVASITVAPGGLTATTDAEGYFELDIAPGVYDVTCAAKGYATQTRKLTVTANGVTTYNFDLRP